MSTRTTVIMSIRKSHVDRPKGMLYISGPMRGYNHFNFEAFDEARDILNKAEYDVISPADIDRVRGFDAIKNDCDGTTMSLPQWFNVADAMTYDVAAIEMCTGVAVLEGWEDSEGSRIEVHKAFELWKPIRWVLQWVNLPVKQEPVPAVSFYSQALLDLHKTGVKDDVGKPRVELMFADFNRALLDVAMIATLGAKKYTDGGWRDVPNGFSRYTGAMGRHILKENTGEDHDSWSQHFDGDAKRMHLAQTAWNALARLELYRKEA